MKKLHVLPAFMLLAATASLAGCKNTNTETEQLQKFVEEINLRPNQKLPNGTILNKCEYKQGDSFLTYYISVPDNRLQGVNNDSLRAMLLKNLAIPEMRKLTKTLSSHKISLRYIYDMEKGQDTITFDHSVLYSAK